MNPRTGLRTLACTLGLLLSTSLVAQQPQQPNPPAPPVAPSRPPMERAMVPHGPHGPHGRWWNNPQVAQKIGLTEEQRKKMDDIFQQHRLKLVDLDANLKKEEIAMEPLVNADQPDESKLLAQIDRVAQARAELEKANARMLLGIRRVLTADQWKKLQEEQQGPNGMRPGMGMGGGHRGPDGPPMEGGPHGMEE